MMGKKLVAVLFGLLMIGMAFSAGSAFAGETVTVILVSDNAADKTIAQYLANLTGAIVVTTTWGVYNPNVTAEILSYAPDQVIIIGGPEAVVDEYVTDLQEYNITVYRWWGANRYETDLAVIGNASKLFGIKFNASVVVAGNDSLAIQTALKLAVENRAMIIYVNQSTNVSKLMERFQVREMVMVQSKASEKIMEKVEKELQKCNCRAERVQANVTKEQVEQIMEQVRERLMAVEEIANMTNSTQLMEQVREMLQLMEKVNQSLQAGNVTEAYVLALQLQARSEFALKNAHMDFKMAVKSREKFALEMELEKLEAQVEVLEKAGVNVSTVKTILDKAEEAIKAGNYSVAKVLLKEAKKALHELYREKKSVISMPGTGGHDEKSGKH
ncbi:cell wall-binding repeat 2 family protein [Thermococcus sp.]|uniref:cell wall-binding repeat 2 family protein n=1 Tax=Thermococcus sp. TaxID=35749 RepID=UPI002626D6B3|nr:cell wall-binding repeat 2 family protein [Thermococcus sp.]